MRAFISAILTVLSISACGEIVDSNRDANTSVDALNPDGAIVSSCDECSADATCDTSGGSPVCNCNDGFTGNGVACDNINECLTDNGGCHELALCTDLPGSRVCTCASGTIGDGLTCINAWVLVDTLVNFSIYDGFGIYAAGRTGRLYFAPQTNTSPWFKSYDLVNGVFNDEANMPLVFDDFCACGDGGWLTAHNGDLYYFANWGQIYTAGAWGDAPYPAENRRGEAAIASFNGRIYMVGGRGFLATVQSYSGGTNGTWSLTGSIAPYPWPISDAVAAALNGRLYVMGGTTSTNEYNKMASYDPNTNLWTPLLNLPTDISRPLGAGSFQGRVFVTSRQRMYFYDPANPGWTSLPLPAGAWYVPISAGNKTYLVGQNGSDVLIYQLVAVP